jgi:hypothetical protein
MGLQSTVAGRPEKNEKVSRDERAEVREYRAESRGES